MGIPAQVQEAAAKADELLKNQNAVPEQKKDEPEHKEGQPTPQQPAVQPPPADELAKWEQRYRSLQGIVETRNQEIQRLRGQLGEATATITKLQADIEAVKKPKAAAEVIDPTKVLSEDDLEYLRDEGVGPRTLSIIGKLTQQIAGTNQQVDPGKLEQIEKRVDTVEKTTAQGASDKFFSRLERGHSDWEQVNEDANWRLWLGSRVPGTNYTRQDIIDASQARLDPTDIVNLMSDWKAEVGWGKKPQPKPKSKMEEQVEVINPSSKVIQGQQGDQRRYTRAEITAFYSGAAAKKLASLDPQEYARQEQDILQASIDGRVEK